MTATRTDIVCTAADRIVVGAFDVPDFDIAPADTALCVGTELRLGATFAEGQSFLENGSPFDTTVIAQPGRYRFTYVHPCGVQNEVVDVSYSTCRRYYVANAFSPNGDGTNDTFFPQDDGDILRIHRFMVFDRWGGLLFTAEDLPPNNPLVGWDGSYGGQPALTGTYVWVMDADFRSGDRSVERGTVNIIR